MFSQKCQLVLYSSINFPEYLTSSQLLKRGLNKIIEVSPKDFAPKTGIVSALSKFLLWSPGVVACPSISLSPVSLSLLSVGVWSVVARIQEPLSQ